MLDVGKLLEFLKANEGGGTFAEGMVEYIENHDKYEEDSKTLAKNTELIGDRDLGELIGFSDYLKSENLGTTAEIVDFKNKAEGAQKTAAEVAQQLKDAQEKVREGSVLAEQISKDAEQKLFLANVKTAMSPYIGDRPLNFDSAITRELGNFTTGEKGEVLFNGKPVAESIEYMRENYGDGFKAAPSGTGELPQSNNSVQHQSIAVSSFDDVVKEMK